MNFEDVASVHKYYSVQIMAVIWVCVAFSFLQSLQPWISVVTIGYSRDDQGIAVELPAGTKRIFLQLWGPPSLISSGKWRTVSLWAKVTSASSCISSPRMSSQLLGQLWLLLYICSLQLWKTFFTCCLKWQIRVFSFFLYYLIYCFIKFVCIYCGAHYDKCCRFWYRWSFEPMLIMSSYFIFIFPCIFIFILQWTTT